MVKLPVSGSATAPLLLLCFIKQKILNLSYFNVTLIQFQYRVIGNSEYRTIELLCIAFLSQFQSV